MKCWPAITSLSHPADLDHRQEREQKRVACWELRTSHKTCDTIQNVKNEMTWTYRFCGFWLETPLARDWDSRGVSKCSCLGVHLHLHLYGIDDRWSYLLRGGMPNHSQTMSHFSLLARSTFTCWPGPPSLAGQVHRSTSVGAPVCCHLHVQATNESLC